MYEKKKAVTVLYILLHYESLTVDRLMRHLAAYAMTRSNPNERKSPYTPFPVSSRAAVYCIYGPLGQDKATTRPPASNMTKHLSSTQKEAVCDVTGRRKNNY